jgi:hypothetical protein
MTDQPSPFAPFQPSPPISPEPAANTEKPARQKRRTKAEMAGEAPAEKPAKKPALKSHAPKFDLQTTLAAAKMLNEDDFPMFEKLVIMFDEAGKPQRDRVLAAVAKVFA